MIGLGTSGPFEVGAADAERAPLREVLQAFFAAGGGLIDTSPMYSTAEGVLGDLLTPDMQARAFMATKVWTRGARSGHRADDALAAGAQARAPRPDPGAQPARPRHAAARRCAHWKAAGKVRYLGVTHYTVGAHAELDAGADARAARLRAVQLLARPRARPRRACCRSPPSAASRCWSTARSRTARCSAPCAASRCRAGRRSCSAASWGQLALKFIAAHPAVTCIIPATGKRRAPARQPRRRARSAAGCRAARGDREAVHRITAGAAL